MSQEPGILTKLSSLFNEYVEAKIMIKIIRETTIALLIFNFLFELTAGALLSEIGNFNLLLPGLLLIVPGLLEMRGNISSSFAQRLGSAVHLGIVSWESKFNEEIIENLKAVILLSLINVILLVSGSYVLALIRGIKITNIFGLFLISILTTLIALLFIPATIIVSLYFHKRGIDPDNVVIPILSSLNDVIIASALLGAIRFTLWIFQFLSML